MNGIIEASQLRYRYTPKAPPVLDEITLSVPAGSALALLGPNGAGKTTLLDLILGWRSPESGRMMVKSQNPSQLRRSEAGKLMSLAAQSESITFSFPVVDYVLFGRAPHLHQLRPPSRQDRETAMEALRTVNILHLADREVTKLSGGELQLVKIARSIAQQTEILLLDEPTSDLDPGNTVRIMEIMEQQKRLGITQVFTTHDPMIASDIATHTALIRSGKLLFFGPPEQALTSDLLSRLYSTPMSVHHAGPRRIIIRGYG